jgi:hypothetical protein
MATRYNSPTVSLAIGWMAILAFKELIDKLGYSFSAALGYVT